MENLEGLNMVNLSIKMENWSCNFHGKLSKMVLSWLNMLIPRVKRICKSLKYTVRRKFSSGISKTEKCTPPLWRRSFGSATVAALSPHDTGCEIILSWALPEKLDDSWQVPTFMGYLYAYICIYTYCVYIYMVYIHTYISIHAYSVYSYMYRYTAYHHSVSSESDFW